ncbi:hypothetical protein KO481_06940 [Nocardia sp. NEAU-G5]|uniref:Transposase n=1 Tax=Nocardia albiluteola TaxID=2842303 RepID=A0ABS6AWA8_9NOCA|nr:hypothetical protein [Nocardia albiluteola]MBU3061255.1 hypothetical protein [Nocardia albiluteola]
MTLEDVTAELYGLDPGEFIEARDARARAARDAGDRALATEIGGLRRPAVAAWAINLLVRDAPAEVGALLDLGAALNDAQRRLSGDQLRSLTTQRRRAVNALADKAGRVAAEHGRPPSTTVLREIGETLNAALADPAVAERVRTGTLTTTAKYEGFGPSGPALTTVPEPPTPPPDPGTAVRKELEEAVAALESATRATDSARAELDLRAAELARLDDRLATLRRELDDTEQQRRFAASAERAAREALRKAELHLTHAQHRVERARPAEQT